MKRKMTAYLAAVVVWFGETTQVGAQAPPATKVPEYTVIDLGTLGGSGSYAAGINDNGEVVGSSLIRSNLYEHAFLYSNGSMKDLGTLGGNESHATGINNSGQVVGLSMIMGKVYDHSFLYSNGSMKDFDTLGGDGSSAYGINNSGQVVGAWWISGASGYHAFLYANGSMQDLGTLGGDYSMANGINNSGQVVGWSITKSNSGDFLYSRAFLYSNGMMKNLGTLADNYSSANGINNIGEVVGQSVIRGGSRAFLYSNGMMKDLGILGGGRTGNNSSEAYGINDSGQVVGTSVTRGNRYNHAFLYSNGSMRDLNDLIDPASGWELTQARAINNAGQIVGNGTNPNGQQHAFLLNPLPSGWRQVIEAPPLQPTYSEPPKKENAKDSLIVVTHGRVPRGLLETTPPVDIPWVDEMTNAIISNLTSQGLKNWQVISYNWIPNAWTTKAELLLGVTIDRAEKEGGNLGNSIATKEWKHVHLIAHSAGAALIQSATEKIKEKWKNTTVHLTFLDPYVGVVYDGRNKYGNRADWADNYFTRDLETSGEVFTLTEGALKKAYDVDVTFLDKSKTKGNVYRSSSGSVVQQCQEATTSHEWPYKFYLKTITQETAIGSEGFGFPLSKEGGNWDFATKTYTIDEKSSYVKVLGTPDPSCLPSLYETTPAYIGQMNFFTTPSVSSTTGIVQKNDFGVTFVSVVLQGLKTQSLTPRGLATPAPLAGPAWLASTVIITNAINLVSFDSRFLSQSGAEGLLTVYSDANVIGTIDERVTSPGIRQYTFPVPRITNGIQTLGFRLDSFSSITSSATITNVSLGFVGVQEPFSLSFSGSQPNGTQILQLTGQKDFNYTIETSTDLVGWKVFAILVNTNGVVRFNTIPDNAIAHFYRAVVP